MKSILFKHWKFYFHFVQCLLISFILIGCTAETDPLPNEEEEQPLDAVKVVTVTAENILSGNGHSRSLFTLENDKLKFSWTEGDKIGVYPSNGTQIAFAIKSGAGGNTAKFDGGSWALRETEAYAAYYPYDENNATRKNTQLRFSYEGQCQTGNASLAHLGAYDWMATQATQAVDKELNFQFKHLNCVAQLRLSIPAVATFHSLTIRCDEDIFTKVANLDLSGTNFVYSATETTSQLQMELKDISTTSDKKDLILYMTLPPVDMMGKSVAVVLHSTNNKVYQGVLESKILKAGYAYSFTANMVDVTVSSTITSPNFGTSDKEI